MAMHMRSFFATVSFLLCAATQVSAQDTGPAAPEPESAAPVPPSAADSVVPAAATPQGTDAMRALVQLAESERSARYASAYSLFIGGAAAIAAGLVADLVYERGYGRAVWIFGAVAEVGGVVNLFMAHPFERMAREAEGWSPSQLKSEWARRALIARNTRKVGGVVGLSLGALVIGAGAAVAAGMGDLSREAKQDWTTTLIVFGGAVTGGGLTSLLVESPFESSYRIAYDSEPSEEDSLTLRVGPTLGGAAVSLHAHF
jgi:MFS family permease